MKKRHDTIEVQKELLPDGTMSPRLKAFLEEGVRQAVKNPIDYRRPPWIAFPNFARYSIGWRMGGGEDYWHAFHEWVTGLSESERNEFIAENPEIEGWEGFYEKFYD